jgi:hypothetical protein
MAEILEGVDLLSWEAIAKLHKFLRLFTLFLVANEPTLCIIQTSTLIIIYSLKEMEIHSSPCSILNHIHPTHSSSLRGIDPE